VRGRRALTAGDAVCLTEAFVEKHASTFAKIGVSIKAHVPMDLLDVEIQKDGRRLLYLYGGILCWPSECHLADGPAERFHRRDVALTAKVAKMKEERRAKRKGKRP